MSSQPRLQRSAQQEHQQAALTMVHLGIGAFHRAHQAVYTQQANTAEQAWKIVGVSLRSSTVAEQLNPQGGVYTVVVNDASGSEYQQIDVVDSVLVAPQQPQAVLGLLADSQTKIVSLTITEKGYCHDPASGTLDKQNPAIQQDLANQDSPKSAIGYLVNALAVRKANNDTSLTIVCCDNLPNNGDTLRGIVLEFAALVDKELAAWIAQNVPFPNTMVDRIVPATTEDDISALAEAKGYCDMAMVKTERFSQWVIEDKFAGPRPQWQDAGAMLVEDVAPFEHAKLRLLNGAHSSLAYAGFLCDYQFVHQVMQDADFAGYLQYLMTQEIKPTLTAPAGLDLDDYIQQLLERFRNPSLHHRTYQIAMDGSQKVPQRLLNTISERLADDQPIDGLSFAVAAWLRYTMAFDAKGEPIEVQDPLAGELYAIQAKHFYQIDELIDNYLAFDKVFNAELGSSPVFRQRLSYWLSYILANGVPTALKSLLSEVQQYPSGTLG